MNLSLKNEYFRYRRYFTNLSKGVGSKKISSFAWLSLSIFTVSFFSLMAIRPTLVTIAKLNREIKDKRLASQKLQEKIDSIIAAQAEQAKYVDFFPLLDEALPGKSEFPRLAYFFEQIASSSGVQLKTLSFERIESDPKSFQKRPLLVNSFNFTVSATGQYLTLKEFLNQLEASRRILKTETAFFEEIKKEDFSELSLRVSGQASFEKKADQKESQK
ncbi:MAG TPA: type 4a pilus biogenesis protein PilO [Clostridia bacterium]|nr:type 4a pilus biogenesis protein PilO [Clostridia bacterium]